MRGTILTKGYIVGKSLVNKNKWIVRIPILDSIYGEDKKLNQNSSYLDATVSYTPGIINNYNVNDVVYIGFESNSYSNPIILGKLYIGEENKATNNANFKSLNVVGQTTLSSNTSIGNISYKTLSEALKNIDNKQIELRAGNNIKIENNVISALIDTPTIDNTSNPITVNILSSQLKEQALWIELEDKTLAPILYAHPKTAILQKFIYQIDGNTVDTTIFLLNSYYQDDISRGFEWNYGGYLDGSNFLFMQGNIYVNAIDDNTTIHISLVSNYNRTTNVELNSPALITSGGVYTGLSLKQAKLISGTNIKTINGNSLLGSGDVAITSDNDYDKLSNKPQINDVELKENKKSAELNLLDSRKSEYQEINNLDLLSSGSSLVVLNDSGELNTISTNKLVNHVQTKDEFSNDDEINTYIFSKKG